MRASVRLADKKLQRKYIKKKRLVCKTEVMIYDLFFLFYRKEQLSSYNNMESHIEQLG